MKPKMSQMPKQVTNNLLARWLIKRSATCYSFIFLSIVLSYYLIRLNTLEFMVLFDLTISVGFKL
jgi:hypothetical protein